MARRRMHIIGKARTNSGALQIRQAGKLAIVKAALRERNEQAAERKYRAFAAKFKKSPEGKEAASVYAEMRRKALRKMAKLEDLTANEIKILKTHTKAEQKSLLLECGGGLRALRQAQRMYYGNMLWYWFAHGFSPAVKERIVQKIDSIKTWQTRFAD